MDHYKIDHGEKVDPEADGTCTYQGRVIEKGQTSFPPGKSEWVGTTPAALICNHKKDFANLVVTGMSADSQTLTMNCAEKDKTNNIKLADTEYLAEMKCTFAKADDPWNFFAQPGFIMVVFLLVALFLAIAFHHISVERSTHLNLQR